MNIREATRGDLRWAIAAAVLLAALQILSWRNYAAGTVLWLACGVLLTFAWPRPAPGESAPRSSRSWLPAVAAACVAIGCGWTLLEVAVRSLPSVFAWPPDSKYSDMLPAINLATDEFLKGGNPYRFYHVPWEVPLNYGPVLWMPYVLPKLLHFDPRIWTLAGQLTVPAACALAAVFEVRRGRWVRASVLTGLVAALAWQPQLLDFFQIGHTQVYWPLLLVFAMLVAGERWTAACVALGLLVAARTTMVAIVPVFLMTLWREQALTWRRAAIIAVSAAGPFVPFLLTAPKMVFYGLYGVYMKVVKGYVWHETTWALTTFGSTRVLLLHGLERYLETVQAGVMLITYGAAWLGLRARHPPLPWMAFALLAFCMTLVWPVLYVFFDVWILAAAGLAAATFAQTKAAPRRAVAVAAALYVATFVVVLVAGARVRGASFAIDVGTPASVGMTGGGFGADVSVAEGDRTFVWVEGTAARVRLPRAGLFGARIHVTLRPFGPVRGLRQTVIASLNDHPIGRAEMTDGWQDVTFDTDRSRWLYGFNMLTLEFGYATSAASAGTGPDEKPYSAAIDRIVVTGR